MSTRVQVVVSDIERETFRQAAAREGLSLSDWFRRAARDRLSSSSPRRLSSQQDLKEFFVECDKREKVDEPDWREHRTVIEESRAEGRPRT